MNQTHMNSVNTVKQTSLSNSALTTTSSSSTDVQQRLDNIQTSDDIQTLNDVFVKVYEKTSIDFDKLYGDIENVANTVDHDFETLYGDKDINQLNFQELYAQHHCMDPSSPQLTPQQLKEICTHQVSPNVDNILRKFFNKSLKLED